MSPSTQYDYLIKLLLIGDSGVGKSCLLIRFSDGQFLPSHIATIGIDFKIKTMEVEGKKVKLQIWDTAGQERFRNMTQAYYRSAMGIMLVYDVSNKASFQNVQSWMKQIESHADENVVKLLVGNKSDIANPSVPTSDGQAVADDFGARFIETSAKNGTNVNEAFLALAEQIVQKILETTLPPPSAPNIRPGRTWDGSRFSLGGVPPRKDQAPSNSQCCAR